MDRLTTVSLDKVRRDPTQRDSIEVLVKPLHPYLLDQFEISRARLWVYSDTAPEDLEEEELEEVQIPLCVVEEAVRQVANDDVGFHNAYSELTQFEGRNPQEASLRRRQCQPWRLIPL